MSPSKGTVPDGGVVSEEGAATTDGVLESLGPYRYVVWFAVLEAVLLGIAILLDQGLGVSAVGGLLAAFTVLIAIGGGLGVTVLLGYRLLLR